MNQSTEHGPLNFTLSPNSTGLFILPNAHVNPVNAVVMPIFSFTAMVIIYLPARDFYLKGNFAACSLIASVTYLNFYQFINAIIWHSDITTKWFSGVGLCDLQVNSRYMLTTALLTTMTCFIKNLAGVFNTTVVFATSSVKRRNLIFDILFCWLLPFLQVCFHYCVSVGRFSVFPIYGCFDELDGSWPYLVGYLMWGPIFAALCLVYAIRLFRGLLKYRKTIGTTLASSGSGMTSKYFVKLSIIALSLAVVWVPCQLFYTYLQFPRPLHGYNYTALHEPASWNPIVYLPTALNGQLQYNGWSVITTAFMIFVYFGFNNDAIDTYRSWLVKCGLGKIWPSLKGPRVQPRAKRSNNGSSQGSLIERLDLVAKAMKLFDGGLKNSQATSTTDASTTLGSTRKGSQGTMNTNSTLTDTDAITPLPRIPEISSPHLYSGPIPPRPTKRPYFSAFRTHIILPFPLFNHRTQNSSSASTFNPETHACSTCGRARKIADLENQVAADSAFARQPGATTSTNIWSETGQFFESIAKGHEKRENERAKMGTRAYREKEDEEKIEMSGAVVVEKKVERRETDVNGKNLS